MTVQILLSGIRHLLLQSLGAQITSLCSSSGGGQRWLSTPTLSLRLRDTGHLGPGRRGFREALLLSSVECASTRVLSPFPSGPQDKWTRGEVETVRSNRRLTGIGKPLAA